MSEPELVLPGYKILLELVDDLGEREEMTVQIVPDAYADIARGFLGESTPLCQAIYGQAVGSEIAYRMGDIRAVRIVSAAPTDEGPDQNVAKRREEIFRKAVDQSNRTDAINFASSFSGKWGDYDPSSMLKEEDDDKS